MARARRHSRLYLMRHGEVSAEWGGRIYGSLDVPLSERGRAQSRAAAQALAEVPIQAVVSSGLERAEFAAALLRDGLPHRPEREDDPRLLEIDRGAWAGVDRAGLEALQPGAWDAFWDSGGLIDVPGGEGVGDVAARVLPALDAWSARDDSIAIVAHKWVLRVALCAATGLAPEASARFEVGHTGLAVIDWPRPNEDRDPGSPAGSREAVLVALMGAPDADALRALAPAAG